VLLLVLQEELSLLGGSSCQLWSWWEGKQLVRTPMAGLEGSFPLLLLRLLLLLGMVLLLLLGMVLLLLLGMVLLLLHGAAGGMLLSLLGHLGQSAHCKSG